MLIKINLIFLRCTSFIINIKPTNIYKITRRNHLNNRFILVIIKDGIISELEAFYLIMKAESLNIQGKFIEHYVNNTRKNRARMEHDFFYFAPIKSFTIVYSPMVLNLLYRSVINSSSESLRSSVREVFRHFSISSDCCLTSL